MSEEDKWKRRLERERNARKEAERLLEDKSYELYLANKQLAEQVEEKGSQLAAEEQRFAAIFEASTDGILLLDGRSRITEMNKAAETMIGATRDRFIGRTVGRLVSPAHRKLAYNSFLSVLELGFCRYEADLVRSDGSLFSAEIVGSHATVDGKEVIQGIIRDVTTRRKAVNELKAARRQAEQANEAKSLFLATMSHEIRTPLNGILGFTDLVLNSELGSEQRQNLEMVQRSGDILLHIINDILDFSRIESGKLELETIDFPLVECIEEVLDLHAPAASAKSVNLLYEVDPELPASLCGDITRLRQVLMNLTSNAIKFTPAGTIFIRAQKQGDLLRVAVEDTGIGFAPEKAESLFKSFHQEDVSTTRTHGGTGLGLAICRSLIERMGGTISAQSQPGIKTVFSFEIPLVVGKAAPHLCDPDENTFAGKRALVVDDHEANLIFMRKLLTAWGIHVTTAIRSSEGLALAEQEHFDILLLDMMMPKMDGFELAKKVRHISQVPMILVTSARLSGDTEKAHLAGFQKVLFKPLRRRDLASALRILLSPEEKLAEKEGSPSQKVEASPAKKHILIAEDNAINSRLATLILTQFGCTSVVAANGLEAIAALKQDSTFHAIMMDMRMPEMDGLEATRRIRQGAAGQHYATIPILAVTANALKADEEACLAAGMDHYLAKPLRPPEVRARLQELGVLAPSPESATAE